MRFLLCVAGLTVVVAAAPRPQDLTAPTATVTIPVFASTSLNIPVTESSAFPTLVPVNGTSTSRRTRRPHSEPLPIFSKSCDCPNLATVAYPCWATDSLQSCAFQELHSWICWTSANYGCPSPTRSCENLFTPTPVTGKHPCDLGPGFAPEPTEPPVRF